MACTLPRGWYHVEQLRGVLRDAQAVLGPVLFNMVDDGGDHLEEVVLGEPPKLQMNPSWRGNK